MIYSFRLRDGGFPWQYEVVAGRRGPDGWTEAASGFWRKTPENILNAKTIAVAKLEKRIAERERDLDLLKDTVG